MPSQQEVRWSQLKIGVIVLVSAVILTSLLFLMTGSTGMGLFSHKLTITTYFENSAGLKVGAPVNLEGVTIGSVKSISVSTAPERKLTPVLVVMKIDSKYQPSLHKDSIVSLPSNGVLGDTVVDINSQRATAPMLQDGDELKTLETPSLFDVMKEGQGTIENLNVILSKLNTIVDNIQTGKGSVGQLISNPDLYNKFAAAADNINMLTAKLNRNDNTVGKLFNDNADMYNRMNDTVAKLQSIASDMEAGKGSAGILLKDPTFANNLSITVANLKSLTSDMQAGKGSAGLLLEDPVTAQKLKDAIAQTDTLLAGINEGKGSLGKLAKDDSLFTNANKVLTDSSSLVTAIRQDPKKYLSIKLHIF